MKKRFFLSGAIILLIVLGAQYSFAAAYSTGTSPASDNPSIILNTSPLEATALINDGGLYLPVRAISEALGYTVSWSQETRTVGLSTADKTISMNLKDAVIKVGDHDYYIQDSPIIINGRTFASADFFSENLALEVNWDKALGKVMLTDIPENAIIIKTTRIATETKALKQTIQYPVISGLENSQVQDQINGIFRKAAEDAAREGVKNAADLAPFVAQYPDMPSQCETYFNYHIKYNQNNTLSLIFLNYQYSGGAHGGTLQTSYTFNLKTGSQYGLKDLFKAGTDYVTIISDSIKKQLVEKDLVSLLFEPFTKIRDDHSYYLSGNGVTVYFQQYEIMPYVAGIQAFTTDYALLNFMPVDPGVNWPLVKAGEKFSLSLKGNPTTGYMWHYKIADATIVSVVSENITADSGLIGAGSTFAWDFKALKAGATKITFKYYRDWEGEASTTAENSINYNISVN